MRAKILWVNRCAIFDRCSGAGTLIGAATPAVSDRCSNVVAGTQWVAYVDLVVVMRGRANEEVCEWLRQICFILLEWVWSRCLFGVREGGWLGKFRGAVPPPLRLFHFPSLHQPFGALDASPLFFPTHPFYSRTISALPCAR